MANAARIQIAVSARPVNRETRNIVPPACGKWTNVGYAQEPVRNVKPLHTDKIVMRSLAPQHPEGKPACVAADDGDVPIDLLAAIREC